MAASMRALWKGVIEADNLSVPVKLYTAVRPHEIHFRMLHDQDGVPVRQVLECPVEGKEVPREHAVKGYEVRKDQYVIVNDEDLEGCGPEASRSISVLHFVDPATVDPIYFEKAQYLGPDEHAERPYATFVEALRRTGKAAVVQYVTRGKQYLAMVRPLGDALCLEQMRYADEVLPAEELASLTEDVDASVARPAGSARKKRSAAGAISDREVAMADQGRSAARLGEVGDLTRRLPKIRRHPDGADLEAREHGLEHLVAVLGLHENAVPLLDPLRSQRRCHGIDPPLQVSPCPAFLAPDEADLVPVTPGRLMQEVGEVHDPFGHRQDTFHGSPSGSDHVKRSSRQAMMMRAMNGLSFSQETSMPSLAITTLRVREKPSRSTGRSR